VSCKQTKKLPGLPDKARGRFFYALLLIKLKVKLHLSSFCHSGLSGIFLCPLLGGVQGWVRLQKDPVPKAFGIAGMTNVDALLMTYLVIPGDMNHA